MPEGVSFKIGSRDIDGGSTKVAQDGAVCHGVNMPQHPHTSAIQSLNLNQHQINAEFLNYSRRLVGVLESGLI